MRTLTGTAFENIDAYARYAWSTYENFIASDAAGDELGTDPEPESPAVDPPEDPAALDQPVASSSSSSSTSSSSDSD